jgi:hypothetical protein
MEILVLIRERTTVTADLLEHLPELRLISQRSAFPLSMSMRDRCRCVHSVGRLGGLGSPPWVAVDVFDEEPLHEPDSPLLQLENVICTPIIGHVTRVEWELQFCGIFDQIVADSARTPTNVINPDAQDRRSPRRH